MKQMHDEVTVFTERTYVQSEYTAVYAITELVSVVYACATTAVLP